ncbi:hypothetical protein [Yoonia sp. 2307UL14-13]|uniref:hypothetical protein n=1 Tax=Yoonia sp. 2307UL14-13 TaxID=3126506 RepID=UPI00309B54F1
MFDFAQAGMAFAFLIGVAFWLWGAHRIARTTKILISGGVAEGAAYQARYTAKGTLDQEVSVSIVFTSDQGEFVEFRQMVPVVRETYRVYYDRAKPARAVVYPWLQLFYGTFLLLLGGYFVSQLYADVLQTFWERL